MCWIMLYTCQCFSRAKTGAVCATLRIRARSKAGTATRSSLSTAALKQSNYLACRETPVQLHKCQKVLHGSGLRTHVSWKGLIFIYDVLSTILGRLSCIVTISLCVSKLWTMYLLFLCVTILCSSKTYFDTESCSLIFCGPKHSSSAWFIKLKLCAEPITNPPSNINTETSKCGYTNFFWKALDPVPQIMACADGRLCVLQI